MNSHEFRTMMNERRKALSETERDAASNAITQRILDLKQWKTAETVALYLSFGSEVSTERLIREALTEGKTVVIPVCQSDYKLLFSRYTPETPLVTTSMGLDEIAPTAIDPVEANTIDFCLVPGLAFDTQGHRIGYGAGYYDRFLPTLSKDCFIIACAFDAQVYHEGILPQNETDYPLGYLVTEKNLYRFLNV